MKPALKDNEESDTIYAIAKDCITRADGDTMRAAKLMERTVMTDNEAYHQLMDPLVSMACLSAVSKVHRDNRSHIWLAPNYTAGGNGKRVHALAAGNLLMFPLLNGQRLGEATKDEVIETADFYKKQSKDMSTKATWLFRIAEKLTGKKKVATVFTEDALRKLQTEVSGA